MKKNWGLQSSKGRMIVLFIVDILSIVIDAYLAIILRFKLDRIWVPEEYMNECRSIICWINSDQLL